MIEYKGYIGVVNFDPEIDLFHGTIINTNDVITFYGASVSELREEMQKSIEGYIEFCKEHGKMPEKPFTGEFTVQMSPEMFVRITKEEANRLEHEHNRCKYYGVMEGKSADFIYYDVPEDMSSLLPVLEFAYKKHTGN